MTWHALAGETSNLEWLEEEPSSTPPLPEDSRQGTPSRKDSKKEAKPKDVAASLVAARSGIVEMVIEILSSVTGGSDKQATSCC